MVKVKVAAKAGRHRLSGAIRALAASRHANRATAVVPLGPRRSSASDSSFVSSALKRPGDTKPLSFSEAFGALGPPMVIVVLGCVLWTIWLIVLCVAPNMAANVLMNTSALDDGKFWLIPDEWTTLTFFSVAGLVLVLVFYVYVLLKMLVWRSRTNAMQDKFTVLLHHWEKTATARSNGSPRNSFAQQVPTVGWKLYMVWVNFTGIHAKNRKFWNTLLKFHDLVMLSLFLQDLLEAGMPVQLTYGFAALAASNSLSYAVGIIFPRFSALVEILVDSIFDFLATVIYPLAVLHYCVSNFHYDRAVFFINMELLPVGSFERRARMHANPAEIALVRTSFDSLRILDVADYVLRIGMNLAFSYRFKRIVEVLIEIKVSHLHPYGRRKISLKPIPLAFSSSDGKGLVLQRAVPKPVAAVLLIYSVGILVFTHQAISISQSVCSAHSTCVVFAYRWHNAGFCPCRVLVDGDPAPKTYYEWINPVDATSLVKSLAAAGTLETLQLINRQLTVLPEELRHCENLNFISLINCATTELPIWLKELRKIEYLQVEGKHGSDNLGDLAPDLFSNMRELRYLQFGVQGRLLHLPSFDGAPKLTSILLSRLYNITQLPALARHRGLERMELSACKLVTSVPDLTGTVSLIHFALFQGAYLCCNGFLGKCDLKNPYCQNTTCLKDPSLKATPATQQVFEEFSHAVCQPYLGISQVLTPQSIQMCDGIPFRKCHLPGLKPGTSVVGMCYNHRMQVLACNADPIKIQVRRRQIHDRVGAPCDPLVEAWLGCGVNGSFAR